jgi:hypothetical protein
VYRLDDETLAALDTWVRAGGGLGIWLGDQVNREFYNAQLHAAGLLPVQLERIRREETATHLALEQPDHPLMRVFAGAGNPLLEGVQIYQWWETKLLNGVGNAAVLANYLGRNAPALIESTLGKGRVITVTTSADGEWTNWPASPSYVVTALEMVQRLTPASQPTVLTTGMPIRRAIDPERYLSEVTVEPAQGAPVTVQTGDAQGLRWDRTERAGFYTLHLRLRAGGEQRVVYAVNIDPREGDLRHVYPGDLRRRLGNAPVRILPDLDIPTDSTPATRRELWRGALLLLVLVLLLEQFLAWQFGRRR